MRRKQALGFTLLELAIVILLIGIFMGLGVSALDVQQTNRAFSETREKQEKIKDALVTHLTNFTRLPCPDTNLTVASPPDGNENRVGGIPTGACSNAASAAIDPAIGVLPYLTLGLSRDDALDGWDNFFTYQVSLDNAATATIREGWTLTNTFDVGNTGSITVNDRNSAGGVVPLSNAVAAVVVSHGRNGLGAYTTKGTPNQAPPAATDESDNSDNNSIYFDREFTDVLGPAGGSFDDVVLVLTPTDLLTPAISGGALRSANAKVLEQLRTIRDTAFGRVPPGPPACVPPTDLAAMGVAVPGPVATDPWGQTINYLEDTQPLDAAVTGDAFCLWSSGPNGVSNSLLPIPPTLTPPCPAIIGDDIGLPPVTYDQLRTAYSPAGTTLCF